MQFRFSLPFISALVVAASVTSCQRKAEEAFSPAGEIAFTVVSPSQTKSSDAETSPVSIPVKSDGVQGLTLEVSSRPWAVEESSTAATKVTPSSSTYFTSSHNPFYVAAYSGTSASNTTNKRWEGQATYSSPNTWTLRASSWPSSGTYQAFCCFAPTTVTFNAPNISFTVNNTVVSQTDLLVSKKGPYTPPVTPGNTVELHFTHALTGVKFAAENITINSVEIKGINNTGTYDVLTQQWSGQTGSQNYSVTSNVTAESSTMMLIPQTFNDNNATIKVNTNKGSVTIFLNGQTWEAGEMVTYKITYRPPFTFSVLSGTKVAFSKGNLQAEYNNTTHVWTWKFADNQWNYVGNTYNNTNINGKGSADWFAPVDLFGWSTKDTYWGIWNSGVDDDYAGNFLDWGDNSSLKTALGSGWRTLSSTEWDFLLNGRTSEAYRYCKATVHDVSGLVIFPDGYIHPSDVTAVASVNTGTVSYTSNSWTGNAWTKMEAAGCVFLPAAGSRYQTTVSEETKGFYWSSTSSPSIIYTNCAYNMYFSSDMLQTESSGGRLYGHSVRLVANQ